jgi:hypothetical protein
VADIANLPFKADAFDGVVSLHTIHHLPIPEHKQAYLELFRVLAGKRSAVVVNGWDSSLMALFKNPIRWVEGLYARKQRISGQAPVQARGNGREKDSPIEITPTEPKGTFVNKHNARWLEEQVGRSMPVEVRVWRSVSVRFLRTFIHDGKGGRSLLRFLAWLEDRFPRFFGEVGQYPLIVIRKP